jgi:ribosome maturation factor RimP
MFKQNAELISLLQPVIVALGYDFWGLEYFPQRKSSLLRIYIDKAAGITLDDCARVSEQLTGVLDVNDPIQGHYNLEVSSPGLDRPLFTLDQFARFLGHTVKIRLSSKMDDRKNFAGVIKEVRGETVQLVEDGRTFMIPASLIERANIIYNPG